MQFPDQRFQSSAVALTPYTAAHTSVQGYDPGTGTAFGQTPTQSQPIQGYGTHDGVMASGVYAAGVGHGGNYLGVNAGMEAADYQTPVSMPNMHMNSVLGVSGAGL
jgi:hypothetical protein